jgi:murein L,D-transpeptidase YafK
MQRNLFFLTILSLIAALILTSGFFNVEEKSMEGNVVVEKQYNAQIPLLKILDSLHISSADIKLIVSKSAYKMYVVKGNLMLKTYPVVFGFNPKDDKLKEGDGCTPEGVFHLRSMYPHNKWTKFIWIDYPNQESWQKFNAAKLAGKIPQKATIGGQVGIHGVPANKDAWIDNKENWTLGCISMKNKDVNDLFQSITTETLLEVRK